MLPSDTIGEFVFEFEIDEKYTQKKWQNYFAMFILFPMRFIAVVVILLIAWSSLVCIIAFIFNTEAIISWFIHTKSFPFCVVAFFLACLSGINITKYSEKKSFQISIIVLCHIIVFWIPLGYAAYKWRYAYLVDKLAIAEIDKINDYNCQTLIDAFQKRMATFKVSVKSHWAYNDHVGHEWSIYHSFNNTDVKQNPFYINLNEGDTLDIYTVAIEHDNFPDVGRSSRSFLIPWWYLTQKKVNLDQQVYVVENRGRFSGGVSQVNTTYTIQRVGDIKPQPLEEAKKSIPKDSVLKYFFTFRKFYDKKYDIEEKPWVKYMTSKEIDWTKSIYEYTKALMRLYDNPDYNPTEEYVIER